MKISEITAQAVNKWDYIFHLLGIEVGNGKHCPCPMCDGKDRFKFDNQNGRGTYICNQCGSGDGLELIKHYYHCDTKEASIKLAEYLNLPNHSNKIREKTVFKKIDSEQFHNNNIPENTVCKKVEYLLSKTTLGQSEYFTKKGLTFDLPLLENGRIFVPMLNLHNEYAGGQFIESDGSKHLMKSSSKKGAFILVSSILSRPIEVCAKLLAHNEIIICEGLATAIKRESDHLVDFCSYLNALDYPNGMLIGNLGIIPFNPKKYLYYAYIEYIRNTGLNNPLSLSDFGASLNYAINENKKHTSKNELTQV